MPETAPGDGTKPAPLHEIRLWPVMRVALSIALIVLLVAQVDIAALLRSIAAAPLRSVAIAFGLHLAIIVVIAQRWRLVLRSYGVDASLPDAIGLTFVAALLNLTLPGAVGGDFARGWLSYRRGWPVAAAIGSQFLDRLIGLLALGLLIALVAASAAARTVGEALPPWLWLLLPAMALALATVAGSKSLLARHRRLAGVLEDLRRGFAALLRQPGLLLATVMLGLAAHVMSALIATELAQGNGHAISVATGLALFPPVILAGMLPISVGGWGPRELATVGLFAHAGLSTADALAVSVLFGLIHTAAALTGSAAWYLFNLLPMHRRRPPPMAPSISVAPPPKGADTSSAVGIIPALALPAIALLVFRHEAPAYMLAALLLQSAVAFWLLTPFATLYAGVGSLAVTMLGLLQTAQQPADWYLVSIVYVALTIATACRRSLGRDVALGLCCLLIAPAVGPWQAMVAAAGLAGWVALDRQGGPLLKTARRLRQPVLVMALALAVISVQRDVTLAYGLVLLAGLHLAGRTRVGRIAGWLASLAVIATVSWNLTAAG